MGIVQKLAFLFFVLGCSCSPTTYTGGVPNLAQVGPGLWRSGQPTTPAAWAYLKSLGVKTVVKLNFDSEGTDEGALAAGMTVYRLGIQPEGDKDIFDNIANTFVQPDPNIIAKAEEIIAAGGGVLVHCTHGQDRTGLVIGWDRVKRQHMSKNDAYSEMLAHHFHPELHGLHEFWENLQP